MTAMNKKIMVESVALLLDEEEQISKKRRTRIVWTKPWMLRRKIDDAFHTIFKELKEQDSDGIQGYVRMDVDHFEELVHLLSPFLQKQDTNMRECRSLEESCCVTLSNLARGESFRSLAYQFRISNKAISYIVCEVAFAITQALGKEHLKTLKNTEEWKKIEKKIYHRWNFPNGLGGAHGKYIVLQHTKNSGSDYRNYKGSHSIILIEMIGPEYELLLVGINGRNSDGGNWSQSHLKLVLQSGSLNLPDPMPLPGRLKLVPYLCTGDDAFPSFMMKPYPKKGLIT